MPIWLRNFTFKKLEEHYKKEQEIINKQSNTLKNSKEIARPNINPSKTYNANIAKKT